MIDVVAQPRCKLASQEATVGIQVLFDVQVQPAVPWPTVWSGWVIPLRDLVSFSTWTPTAIESVALKAVKDGSWVRLLVRTNDLRRARGMGLRPDEMALRLADLPGGFEVALRRWWEMCETFENTLKLAISVLQAPFVYDEDRFVAFTRAIESLHSTDFLASPAAIDERDQRVQRAIDALPGDLRDWAAPLLEESTPPIARHRIMEVIRSLGDVGDLLAGGDVEAFAHRVISTRNYLTHPTKKLKKKALTGIDRFWHAHALAFLVQAALLVRLGVPTGELAGRQGRQRRFAATVSDMSGSSPHGDES